jgi:hypothetical protein
VWGLRIRLGPAQAAEWAQLDGGDAFCFCWAHKIGPLKGLSDHRSPGRIKAWLLAG